MFPLPLGEGWGEGFCYPNSQYTRFLVGYAAFE